MSTAPKLQANADPVSDTVACMIAIAAGTLLVLVALPLVTCPPK